MAGNPKLRKIEGRHHPLVKTVRRMVRSGELEAEGSVLLETARLVEEALASGTGISQVMVSQTVSLRVKKLLGRLSSETVIYQVPTPLFESLVSVEASQGILALARIPQWREQDLFCRQPALLLALAGVQDPGNLGAILRAAEAFGATGVLLLRGTVSPYNAKVVRATAGALFRIPLLQALTESEAVALLRKNRIPLFAAVARGGTPLSVADFSGPLAVALGSEGGGLPQVLAAAGQPLTIPMTSPVESLNVAVAAAVALYEAARQRNFREGG